jgi:hypothetical protein
MSGRIRPAAATGLVRGLAAMVKSGKVVGGAERLDRSVERIRRMFLAAG